jgi:hypothetical protein
VERERYLVKIVGRERQRKNQTPIDDQGVRHESNEKTRHVNKRKLVGQKRSVVDFVSGQ